MVYASTYSDHISSRLSLWLDVVWSYQGDIVTAYFDGTRFETVVDDPEPLDSPTIAPDGNRLGLARRTALGTEVWEIENHS